MHHIPIAPGIPRSRHFVCSRPFRWAKGAWLPFWIPACAGMTVHPHPGPPLSLPLGGGGKDGEGEGMSPPPVPSGFRLSPE